MIEVLVVSLIIAVIAGTVFLSFDLTERNQVRKMADRFRHALRHLGNEAILSGRICGLQWKDTSVAAQCRTTHGEVEDMSPLLGKLAWGQSMNLSVLGEDGQVLHPKDEEDEIIEDESERPDQFYDIQIWPMGLWEPAGSIVFKSASNRIAYLLLSWTASGRIQVEKVTDQASYIEDPYAWDDARLK